MSYSEEGNEVVLRMSREDYELVLMALGGETARAYLERGTRDRHTVVSLLDRLNEGNPNYTPYKVAEKIP